MDYEPESLENGGTVHFEKKLCPHGTFITDRISCYSIGPVNQDFFQAKDYCLSRGKHLLEPETLASNQMFQDILTFENVAEYVVWIGLTDHDGTGTWIWETTGFGLVNDFWYSGPPNIEGHENCGAFLKAYHWKWGILDCMSSSSTLTICETGIIV
ncbi:perlucin-like protein [Ruditapes philippinarum]|uniref:perlucin-like protein n=1 Tax=Ruditapes philippinarum TaxID=129788 RepID=UPI00295AC419|nr:perlucin-like protein [Ruditapes philippinarum]